MNYDISKWHKGCKKILGPDGTIFCETCGIVANIEAIGAKISSADACKVGDVARIPTGKQSPGVDKGESK